MSSFLSVDALKGGLARKLIIAIVLISSILALIITCVQLYIDYSLGVNSINKNINDVERGYGGSITESVWVLRDEQILEQLKGIVALPNIISAQIKVKDEVRWQAIKPESNQATPAQYLKVHQFVLIKQYKNQPRKVGVLILTASLDEIYHNLYDKVLLIFFSNALKTSIVSLFIFFYFHFFITRHLFNLSQYTQKIRLNKEIQPLSLHRNHKEGKQDELDLLVNSVNSMRENLIITYSELQDKKQHLDLMVKQLEDKQSQLQQAHDQALSASQAKSLFLANMSHEIRTPMNAIMGFAQIMHQDSQLDADHHYSLEAITQASAHLLELINDILDISKIESGEMQLQLSDFSPWEIVQNMQTMFKLRCMQKNIIWHLDNQLQPQIIIKGDQRKLRQILINFLGNALKFTSSGKITLKAKELDDDCYQFEVIDTGPGIADDDQEAILNPFIQTKEGLEQGGTGLGLSISSRQIKLMKGELILESQLGEGCRIIAKLPFVKVKNSQLSLESRLAFYGKTDESGKGAENDQQKSIIAVIIDDNDENQKVLTALLIACGLEVKNVYSRHEIVAEIQATKPHIVFLSMRIKGATAINILKHIRLEFEQEFPCIGVLATVNEYELAPDEQLGFNGFISRPFQLEKLHKCLEHALNLQFDQAPAELMEQNIIAAKLSQTMLLNNDDELPVLTEDLYQKLISAAEYSQITTLKELFSELKTMDKQHILLAKKLERLMLAYDSDQMMALLERVSHE